MPMKNPKTEEEKRFELATWGTALVLFALVWILFADTLPGLMMFMPGIVILGSALYQDIQKTWSSNLISYLTGILMTAVGLTSLVSTFMGDIIQLNWVIVSIAIMGAALVIKAFRDMSV